MRGEQRGDEQALPERSREPLQRQEQDLRREAERRGAAVVAVLEDNDLSGSGKIHRPAFERLIDLFWPATI